MFLSHPYRIYVHDTDVAGVVHHSNYLKYFEAGRIEYLRHLGVPYIDFQKSGIGFVPVDINIRYIKPLREDDQYQIGVQVTKIKKASFVVEQTIISNNQSVVTATIQLAAVKEPEFKPTRLPEKLLKCLEQPQITSM
tara:strand:- start:597 stop:1007 length:411 start_codon:yes stop_codon:yes gene_type:complete